MQIKENVINDTIENVYNRPTKTLYITHIYQSKNIYTSIYFSWAFGFNILHSYKIKLFVFLVYYV